MSERGLRLAGAALLAAGAASACRKPQAPLVTYFQPESAFTLQYPPTWKARLAERDGVRYRYFESQPAGPQRQTVTVTILSASLRSTLDRYVEAMLPGAKVEEKREDTRGRARARRVRAASADGAVRHSLLALEERNHVYGLHSQGPAAAFAERLGDVTAIEDSLALERVEDYPERREAAWAFAVRVPASWRASRTFAGSGTYLTQYLSPPLAVDEGGQTVHASLTVTVEPAPGDGTVAAFRAATRSRLGDAFSLIGFQDMPDRAMDVMQTETPLAVSRTKRFYRTAGGRAYGLAFEAREDVYTRVSRWCDLIASTLRVGSEVGS